MNAPVVTVLLFITLRVSMVKAKKRCMASFQIVETIIHQRIVKGIFLIKLLNQYCFMDVHCADGIIHMIQCFF